MRWRGYRYKEKGTGSSITNVEDDRKGRRPPHPQPSPAKGEGEELVVMQRDRQIIYCGIE